MFNHMAGRTHATPLTDGTGADVNHSTLRETTIGGIAKIIAFANSNTGKNTK
jgi:hypothetical protein